MTVSVDMSLDAGPPRDMSRKTIVAGAALALALLYSGVGYVTGAVPFPAHPRGDIAAADLCESLGDRTQVAAELDEVLPSRRDYDTSDDNPPRSSDDTSWRAHCIVSGDGDQLLYASTELGWDSTAEVWLDEPAPAYRGDEGRREQFEAGSAAVVTKRTAEILVPCITSPGPGTLHLVAEVHAQRPLAGSDDENRDALATLALNAARAAHQRAECALPSRLAD